MIHYKIERSELADGIKRIKQALGRVRKNSSTYQFEVEIFKDKTHLKVPGALIELKSKADEYGRFLVPLKIISNIIRTIKEEEIELLIADHYLKIKNGIEIENSLIQHITSFESILPDLPMNYTDRDILSLRSTYSTVQMKKIGIESTFERALYNYEVALSEAYKHLKLYGVTKTELRALAYRKIDRK